MQLFPITLDFIIIDTIFHAQDWTWHEAEHFIHAIREFLILAEETFGIT